MDIDILSLPHARPTRTNSDCETPESEKWRDVAQLSSELDGTRVCWWLDKPNGIILHGRYCDRDIHAQSQDVCEHATVIRDNSNHAGTVNMGPRSRKNIGYLVNGEYEWQRLDATVHFTYISIDMSDMEYAEALKTPVASFKNFTIDMDRNKWYRVEKIAQKHFHSFHARMFLDAHGETNQTLVQLNVCNNLGSAESWSDGVTITLPLKDEISPPCNFTDISRFLCIADEFVTIRRRCDNAQRMSIKMLTNYTHSTPTPSIKFVATYPPKFYNRLLLAEHEEHGHQGG